MESVPHVLITEVWQINVVVIKTSHIHLREARAGGKRNFVWSHRKFPLDFCNLSLMFGFSQIRRQHCVLF